MVSCSMSQELQEIYTFLFIYVPNLLMLFPFNRGCRVHQPFAHLQLREVIHLQQLLGVTRLHQLLEVTRLLQLREATHLQLLLLEVTRLQQLLEVTRSQQLLEIFRLQSSLPTCADSV